MIIRFTNNNNWNHLENIILGARDVLKNIALKLNENKFGVCIDKQSKILYNIQVKGKSVIVINLMKNQKPHYIKLDFIDKNTSICVDNICEFESIFNNWYEEFIKNPTISNKQPYIRKGIYSIESVLEKTIIDRPKGANDLVDFDGDLIHMASDRYKTFAISGVKCVCCGLEAKYFAKETFNSNSKTKKWHFNLYGVNEEDKEILFTKDHIIPKSKGGKDDIENYQTMCTICNSKKSNNLC